MRFQVFWCVIFVCAFANVNLLSGQIVSIDPAFFSVDSTITVTYDATQGSGGLRGVSQVYTHTGVITRSGGAGNWQYVQGVWGTDDPRVKMTSIGDDKHQITYNIKEFYGIPDNEEVVELSFVFRNVDGSREGKTTTNGDIFIPLPEAGAFDAFFRTPNLRQLVVEQGSTLPIEVVTSERARIKLYDNDVLVTEVTGTELSLDYEITTSGNHIIRFEAEPENMAEGKTASVSLVYAPQVDIQDPPVELELGYNLIGEGESYLYIHAPDKESVFVLRDEFLVDEANLLNKTSDGEHWWIQLSGQETSEDFLYQYLIDGELIIADPLSMLILDPIHDQGVSNLSALPSYPSAFTEGHVSLVRPDQAFSWTDGDFRPAENQDLVIYEVLLRDFLASHSYADLTDTLSYLQRLGVNAIELMPFQEFEANDSWGYNPSYHMALDKYYGTPEELKTFVDAAHAAGIAVIQDVVFNHAFGQSPLVQMYWDRSNGKPSVDSPYFNPDAKHPFNVGFDFNHMSDATRAYVKRCLDYWISEFHIDGFRFDLSKGFTQRQSFDNDVFSAFDADRVALLKEYADFIWDIEDHQIIILEHFADNSEERELADYGMLLWGNGNFSFNEATMGYHDNGKSDFSWQSYRQRGWSTPHIIGYMESHDEERLMYKNLTFGNSSGGYSVKNLATGIERNKMALTFFMTIPGPKMIWQFGELGYEFSINRCVDGRVEGCRLDRKPIRWDFEDQEMRRSLFDLYAGLIRLKKEEDVFETSDFDINLSSSLKTIHLSDSGSNTNAVVIGNFDVVDRSTSLRFDHTGMWYDLITGDSMLVSSTSVNMTLDPGEYHLYFDKNQQLTTSTSDIVLTGVEFNLYPNPTNSETQLVITADRNLDVQASIISSHGVKVSDVDLQMIRKGKEYVKLEVESLSSGLYYVLIESVEGRGLVSFVKE